MYSNQISLTLTAPWSPVPQVVIWVYGGGTGIATQEWQQTLMEEEIIPFASTMNMNLNSGPAPEFPPYAYIGFYVYLLPQGQPSPAGLTGPLFRSGFFDTTLPTPFPTDPNGMISILEIDGSSLPITQAVLDKDVAAGFSLPRRLPAQIIIQSLSTPIGDGEITIKARGTWTAPDGASQTFTYTVRLRLEPSLQMHPNTSEVVLVMPLDNGSLSFDFPNPDPFFINNTDWAILSIFAPFLLTTITPKLASMLTSRLQTQVMNQAATLLGFPAGTSLQAGLVLSVERVRIQSAAGITVVAALGCFGPLSSKLPASSGGGTCLLTFLASIPVVQPAINLAPFHAIRDRLVANHLGRCVIGAYHSASELIVPWLARHREVSLAIRRLLGVLMPR